MGTLPSTPIVKYETAPTLSFNDPDCEVCCVAVVSDGDCYRCPTCGTTWPYNANDGDAGVLYEDWSGETLDLPPADPENAWLVTIKSDRARRESDAEMRNRTNESVASPTKETSTDDSRSAPVGPKRLSVTVDVNTDDVRAVLSWAGFTQDPIGEGVSRWLEGYNAADDDERRDAIWAAMPPSLQWCVHELKMRGEQPLLDVLARER